MDQCPACNSKQLKEINAIVVDNNKRYSLFHCIECDLQFWLPLEKPPPTFYEDEIVTIYKELHKGREKLDKRFKKFFERHPSLYNKKILDLGCGDGVFIEALTPNNELYGVDIDKRSIEVARQRGLKNLYNMDVEEFINYAKEIGLRFDLITMFDLLEHLTDPKKVLEKLKSILKPSGLIVGTLPNRDRLFTNHIKTDFPPHHFYRFSKRSLEQFIKRAGYEPLHIEVFEYGYVNKILLDRLIKRFKKLKKIRSKSSDRTIINNKKKGGLSIVSSQTKNGLVEFMIRLTEGPSQLLERITKKGFKLYFEAKTL